MKISIYFGTSTTFLLIILFAFFALPLVSSAQQLAGVSISPLLIEKGADPGDVLNETLRISNLSDEDKTYYLFSRDISGVRDGGSPIFADEGEITGFELTEWVSLSQTEVTVPSHEEVVVPLTITVPDSATPGSHFGGVFVSVEPPRFREIGAAVGFEVANIISIRISGDVLETAQIRTFSTDKKIYGSTNVLFDARVENKGNVLVRPYGPLEVNNMFGERVAVMTFNDSLGGVFPGTIRDFDMEWTEPTPGFGRYVARLSLLYGGEDGSGQRTITSTVSFWILPMNIIGPALFVLVILLGSTYLFVKLYIRRRLNTLSQGRRVARQRLRRRSSSTLMVVLTAMLTVTAFFLLVLLVLFA